MAANEDSREQEWEIATIEQVADEAEVIVPIKRKLTINGVECDSITLRYPTRGDMKLMSQLRRRKKEVDEDEITENLLVKLSTKPLLTPADMEKMAVSDFLVLQKALEDANFFGIVKKA